MHTKYTNKDLTIVICTYKECETLERSIRALIHQTKRPLIKISTSTPNAFVRRLAAKYNIPVMVNPDGGHVKDYNFALKQVDTRLGMIAHQDDLLSRKFVEESLRALNKAEDPILSFTDYIEMHEGEMDTHPTGLVLIKRMLTWPMRVPGFRRTVLAKRLGQCIGNPITHPSVICVMDRMPEVIFREEYKASMDWDLWERLSLQKGEFVYVPKVLLCHRMSKENATARLLEHSNVRYNEELELLSRFWPKAIARQIMKLYSKSASYY